MFKTLVKNGISLKVQLYALLALLSIWVFLAYWLTSVNHTRQYLNEQMSVHAADAATSLGLSISPYMDPESHMIAKTMASAIFDAGYFASMRMLDTNGDVIFSFKNPDTVEGVPEWFQQWFPLITPEQTTEVNNGWFIAGELSLRSHAGTSYQQLWQHAVVLAIRTLVLLAVGLVFVRGILYAVLKPLKQIEAQAIMVMGKKYQQVTVNTVTTEVRGLSLAMNTMTANIQGVVNSLTDQAEALSQEAFIDPLTKIGNRRSFDRKYDTFVADLSLHDKGAIGLLTLPSLLSVNNSEGYQAGDDYVLEALAMLQQGLNIVAYPHYFRISGGSIVVLMTGSKILHEDAFKNISTKFAAKNCSRFPEGFASFAYTDVKPDSQRGTVLSQLDCLVTQANSATHDISKPTVSSSQGLQQWKLLINRLCESDSIKFSHQPIKATPGNASNDGEAVNNDAGVIYHELYASFYYQQQPVPNSELFAMAERLGLSSELDKKLLESAIDANDKYPNHRIALNLNDHSLSDPSFLEWLEIFVAMNRHLLSGFFVEINESALINNRDGVEAVINLLKNNDVGVSIDRFGQNIAGFKQLRNLNVDYVKLDGSFARDLTAAPENKSIISAVSQIGRSLGVKVIACHVECQASYNLLKTMDMCGMQGNFLQAPMPLDESTQADAEGRMSITVSEHLLSI